MHYPLFDVVLCERLCIPFDVNKMGMGKSLFGGGGGGGGGFFQSLHLNNGVWNNRT